MNKKKYVLITFILFIVLTAISFLIVAPQLAKKPDEILILAGKEKDNKLRMELLQQVVSHENSNPQEKFAALSSMGHQYRNDGQIKKSLEMYEKAIELPIEANTNIFRNTVLQYANALVQNGENNKALPLFKGLLGKPTEPHTKKIAMENIAQIYLNNGQYEKAIEQFQELVKIAKPVEKFNIKLNLAHAFAKLGDKKQSFKEIEKLHPKNTEEEGGLLWATATIEEIFGNRKNAAKYFQIIVDSNQFQKNVQLSALLKLIKINIDLGKIEDAIRNVELANKWGGDGNQVALCILKITRNMNSDDATEFLDQWIIKLNKDAGAQAILYKKRGLVALELKDRSGAINFFKQSLKGMKNPGEKEWLANTIQEMESGKK